MNKVSLRALLNEMRADMAEYFQVQRDAVNAQSNIVNRVFDVCGELMDDELPEGFVSKNDDGTIVVAAPPQTGHAFAMGRCVVHKGCNAVEPPDVVLVGAGVNDLMNEATASEQTEAAIAIEVADEQRAKAGA